MQFMMNAELRFRARMSGASWWNAAGRPGGEEQSFVVV